MAEYTLHLGDCLDVMRGMDANSVDTIVCDPPYMLNFMGKAFDNPKDNIAGRVEVWSEALRVTKPGGSLLAFGGDRTHHRMMVAIEDAGWEIRTCLYWIFGSGFPKSLAIGKSMRKQLSADALCACGQHSTRTTQDSQGGYPEYLHSHDEPLRADQGSVLDAFPLQGDVRERIHDDPRVDVPVSRQANTCPDAANVHLSNGGYSRLSAHQSTGSLGGDNVQSDKPLNTSLVSQTEKRNKVSGKLHKQHLGSDSVSSSLSSPDNVTHSHLPHCTTCGKPIANKWDGWGTALKPAAEIIVLAMKPLDGTFAQNAARHGVAGLAIDKGRIGTEVITQHGRRRDDFGFTTPEEAGRAWSGRWPANLILDEEAARLLDEQSGVSKSSDAIRRNGDFKSVAKGMDRAHETRGHNDSGGASRFFYAAKASRSERERGLEGMEEREGQQYGSIRSERGQGYAESTLTRNHHPTVKPLALMRYLVRLTSTPTGGIVLDPFMGSGSTGIAALQEGRSFVGVELDGDYYAIAEKRIANAAVQPELAAA